MNRIAQLTLLLALCAGTAHADEAAAKSALDAMTAFDAKLVGKHQYGVYMGTQNLGQFHITVERAPEGGGGLYKVTEKASLKLGPNGFTIEKVAVVGAKLEVIEATETRVDVKQGESTTTTRITKREGDKVVREWKRGEDSKRFEVSGAYPDLDTGLPLLMRLIGHKPGHYTFKTVSWPDPDKGETEVKWEQNVFKVAAAKEIQHRGRAVQAHFVENREGEEAPGKLFVGATGEILSLTPAGTPLRILAGTAEEIGKDLPKPKVTTGSLSGVSAPKTPEAAIAIYLKVLSKQLPIDGLDLVFDWDAVYEKAKKNPANKGVTKAQVVAFEKGRIGKINVPAAAVNALIPTLKAEINGDEATVAVDGRPLPLKRHADGSWKLAVK